VSLVFLLGGARSGKSSLAVRLATETGAPVVFVATGEAGDEEMAERIALHRAERPEHWRTVEAPRELPRALAAIDPDACVIVDCIAFWIANVFENEIVDNSVRSAIGHLSERPGHAIVVSNEVGMGVVPATPLGRAYRDALGRVNAMWAEAADVAYLVVAGKTLQLV
jgi:adenosylcobinamide kinase / adenosylcobinamide-phosphate guanylyltransferase